MAKARKILRRKKAVKNIRAVTKTMEMVSTARFKKMYNRAVAARPYTERLCDLVGDLIACSGPEGLRHPLLTPPPGPKCDVLLVLTGNRGLCGSYNHAVLRMATERMSQVTPEGYKVCLRVVGKKGIQFFRHAGHRIEKEYTQLETKSGGVGPDYDLVSALSNELMSDFLAGKISGLEVAYTQLISAGRYAPVIAQVLPLTQLAGTPKAMPTTGAPAPFDLMPSAKEILDRLLPTTVRLQMYQCFLDAAVTEQIARMSAMRAATEAADEMIHNLTVLYNRLRQSQITTELAEIIGGRAGIE
jgi:F-type H+-transporting ATPase subunit gamma